MLESLSALACMFCAALVLWGWGRAVGRLGGVSRVTAPVEIALGMAGMIFIGGVLNMLKLAYRPALDGMLVLGALFAVREWVVMRWQRPRLALGPCIAVVPILCATLLLLKFLTPPKTFNWHDDLERYFSYPIRMLATGTVGGNPLGYMGADSLGAQAFLQAFATSHFSLLHIGTVDWVFALVLCMVVAGFGVVPKGWALNAVLAELLVFAINPLVVNVSSTFTTAFLILGLVFLTRELRDGWRGLFLLGLFYSALLALKTTNAVFVGLHFIVVVLTLHRAPNCSMVRPALFLAVSSVVFLSPWLLTHAANFVSIFKPVSGSANVPVAKIREPLLLFRNALGGYGASPLSYTALALSGIVLSCFVWFYEFGRREVDRGIRAILAACLAAAATYLTLTVWLAPIVFGQIASFRYAVPVLVGVLPAFVALSPSIPDRTVRSSITAAFAAVLVLFIPSTTTRVRTLISSKSTLAFLTSKNLLALLAQSYAPYLAEALGQSRRERIEKIQSLIPAGEPVVSWLMTPYWLNFRRNPVYTVDPYGLAMPWTRVPAANYYMWEYRGFVVRSESRYQEMMADAGASERLTGVRALTFMRELEAQANAGHLIFNDGSIAVWRRRDSVAVPVQK